jgi:HK97 family phage prohead protease
MMKKLTRVFTSEVKVMDEKEMTMSAVISTGSVDRMGEVLEPKGADFRNFKANPVVLWAHDASLPPIAKATSVNRSGNAIVAKLKFATTEFAKEVFALYKDGFMKAFSVGFLPIDSEPMNKDSDSVFAPQRYKKWEMLEFSAVPIPANPEALARAIQKGIIHDEALIKSIEGVKDDVDEQDDAGDDKELDEGSDADAEPEGEGGEAGEDSEDGDGDAKGFSSHYEEAEAENKLLKEHIIKLEEENCHLRYDKYKLLKLSKQSLSVLAERNLADRINRAAKEVMDEITGKVKKEK